MPPLAFPPPSAPPSILQPQQLPPTLPPPRPRPPPTQRNRSPINQILKRLVQIPLVNLIKRQRSRLRPIRKIPRRPPRPLNRLPIHQRKLVRQTHIRILLPRVHLLVRPL